MLCKCACSILSYLFAKFQPAQFEAAGTFKSCGDPGLPKIRAFSTIPGRHRTLLFSWQRGMWAATRAFHTSGFPWLPQRVPQREAGRLAPCPALFYHGRNKDMPSFKCLSSILSLSLSLGDCLQWISLSALNPVTKSLPRGRWYQLFPHATAKRTLYPVLRCFSSKDSAV